MRVSGLILFAAVTLLPVACDKFENPVPDTSASVSKTDIPSDPLPEVPEVPVVKSKETVWLDTLCSNTFAGRKVGTKGNQLAWKYLLEEVEKMGYSPVSQEFVHESGHVLRNILVYLDGECADSLYAIGAHFDGQYESDEDYTYQAANDNASGVVTTLSLLDSLSRSPRPRYRTLVAFWDGEEGIVPKPFKGSGYFTGHMDDARSVVLYINIDAIGHSHGNTMKLGWFSPPDRRGRVETMVKQLCEEEVFDYTLIERGPGAGGSDYCSFSKERIPYISYTDITLDCDHPQHTSRDTKDAIDIPRLRVIRDVTLDILNRF